MRKRTKLRELIYTLPTFALRWKMKSLFKMLSASFLIDGAVIIAEQLRRHTAHIYCTILLDNRSHITRIIPSAILWLHRSSSSLSCTFIMHTRGHGFSIHSLLSNSLQLLLIYWKHSRITAVLHQTFCSKKLKLGRYWGSDDFKSWKAISTLWQFT